jgi:(5-formylfuran-3-yl)methyl phosphate synthase
MRLLISVRDAEEAFAALAGGSDIIDAKEPSSGALGAVDLFTFHRIVWTVSGARPVTAALGDAVDAAAIERTAREYAQAGARLVKIGFAGITSPGRAVALIAGARNGSAEHADVIATAYADAERASSLDPFAIIDAASSAGATGVLLDTADKHGPGLRELMTRTALHSWVGAARDAGLSVALAGKLTADDLGFVFDAGADIAGVRGAACDRGRTGQIVSEKVRSLARVMLGLTLLATGEPVE